MCPCYQTGAQVLWNALAGRLWSRTPIYVYRALARLAGLTEGELRGLVRVSFAKVAEYQKRGGPLPRRHPPRRRHRLRLSGLCGPAAGRVHRRVARGSGS